MISKLIKLFAQIEDKTPAMSRIILTKAKKVPSATVTMLHPRLSLEIANLISVTVQLLAKRQLVKIMQSTLAAVTQTSQSFNIPIWAI